MRRRRAHPASFIVKSAGPYELWCGDFFDLPREAVAGVAGVYDRAALIALPQALRQRYAETLASLLPATARILLITLEYEQSQMAGPPFSVPGDQVRALFAGSYRLEELECRDVLDGHPHFKQRGLTALCGERVSSAAHLSRRQEKSARRRRSQECGTGGRRS